MIRNIFMKMLIILVCFNYAYGAKKVAITQIIQHPSLDAIKKGIEDTLNKETKIIFEDAQGNITTAAQIAQKFISLNPDVIIPITTPSAQAIVKAIKINNSKIPVVFAAISEPFEAGIAKNIEHIGENITGVMDKAPVEKQLELIYKIMPNAKTIGVLYNPSEANSNAIVKEILKLSKIKIISSTVSKTSDVSQAAQYLVSKVDALFTPIDNTIVSAFACLIKIADEAKIPVFASDPESVEKGAIAAIAYDQYALGQQVGDLVNKILNGKSINAMPIEISKKVVTLVNSKKADVLGINCIIK